jgi:hypothetical protein
VATCGYTKEVLKVMARGISAPNLRTYRALVNQLANKPCTTIPDSIFKHMNEAMDAAVKEATLLRNVISD